MEEPGTNSATEPSLHVCPACGSRLVQPTCWKQEGGDRTRWRIWRRCPECEWCGEGVHDETAIDAYDEQLDHGAEELAEELRLLQHANMRELADVFIAALRRDLIGADDFAR
ncbi:MAG TPA: hypothetical protein VFY69_04135 [Solirubrobacterales bacterium]|nr:hypothetical protein [Solirubrobacterales bacterium]